MGKNNVEKVYRLTDDRSGETFILKVGRDKKLIVFDESTKRNRAIRHCPAEPSIFIEDQSKDAYVEPIMFERGQLIVPANDVMTQLFLDSHPDNVSNNGGWFEEVNDDVDAENDVEIDELIQDIKRAIRDKAKEDDGVYALEMIVAVLIDSVVKASEMGQESLKRELYNQAESNPYYFTDDNGNINIFDDEELQRKYLTLRALREGIIKKSPNSKSILWADGKLIATAPRGVDLIDSFADYLSTDEGILVIEEIKRRS